MSLIKIHSLFLFLILTFNSSFNLSAKGEDLNVYLIIDDIDISKSECESWAKSIFIDSKLNITTLKIYSNTFGDAQFPDTWSDKKNKKIANYYSQKISCDYAPCEKLSSFIKEFGKGKSKLFIGDGVFGCDLRSIGLEVGYFKNNSESIYAKIEEEIIINKKLGKDLSLFFYIPSSSSMEKPFVKLNESIIKIKKGETIEVIPTKSKSSVLKWDKTDGLSCLECDKIKLSPKETTLYNVWAENDNGCKSEKVQLTIEVKKQCEDNFQAVKVNYYADNHLYKQNLSDHSKWNVASSQPGSDIYYLICNKNCADNVEVTLLDETNARVWSQDFKREDIESGNKLHINFPNNFILKVNLNSLNSFNKDKYYKFVITSRDEEGNVYEKSTSPLSKFVECGL